MKINNLKYLIILVLPLLLFSCSKGGDSVLRSNGEGILNIDFVYEPDAVVVTKAEDEPVYALSVKDFKTNVIIKTVEDHRSLAETPLKLKAGKYIVTATNGTDIAAKFNSPYYMGADTVEIAAGETATSTIECTLANVKVSIAVTDAVTSNFTKYDVVITNGEGGTLTFDKAHLDSAGFFKCTGTLTWTMNLTNTDGKEFSITNVITNVKPRQYYKLSFDVNGNSGSDQGGASIRVTYDDEMTVKEYDITVNLNKKAYPTVTEASGADITSLLRAPQGAGVLGCININAAASIADVRVSYNSSEVDNANLATLGIPASFSLVSEDNTSLTDKGITWDAITRNSTISAALDMRTMFATKLALGEYKINIAVLDAESQYLEVTVNVKVVPDVEISTIKVDAWGKFAYVYCQYNTETQPDGMGIRYKKASDTEWTVYNGSLTVNGSKYSAKISGLDSSTPYEFMAISTKDVKEDNIITATTEATPQLSNSSFENWYQDGNAWIPAADASSVFWDTANAGVTVLGASNNLTTSESTIAISGKAARLETKVIATKLAAGNLFTGSFGSLNMSTLSATVNFGRPYTARPLRLKGYYYYIPQAINKYDSDHSSLSGQNDYCQIYICLTDWTAPKAVDSAEQNFIDPVNDSNIIAYAELTDNTDTGGYKEFSLELVYRNDRKPTHIVVVAAASKYGDYFTGGKGSILYVDEFTLEFE